MSCREKLEGLHRLCCELHAATSSHVVDAFRFDRGRSEKQVNKAMRLLVGAVAARDPEDCLQALKQFPIEEIESAALAPNPAEWRRAMVRAAEMLVNYGIRLSSDKRSETSAELAVGCNDLLHAIKQAMAAEVQGVPPGGTPQYVTLSQIAAYCQQSKRSAERWKTGGQLPLPDLEGGGGKADQWIWETVRPALIEITGRQLPEVFPTLTGR